MLLTAAAQGRHACGRAPRTAARCRHPLMSAHCRPPAPWAPLPRRPRVTQVCQKLLHQSRLQLHMRGITCTACKRWAHIGCAHANCKCVSKGV